MRKVAITLIKAYRLVLSPFMGQQCRFYPTCSYYGEEAIQRHGVVLGGWLTLKRLLKCHPWHPGGFDEVPEQLTPTASHKPQPSSINTNKRQ